MKILKSFLWAILAMILISIVATITLAVILGAIWAIINYPEYSVVGVLGLMGFGVIWWAIHTELYD